MILKKKNLINTVCAFVMLLMFILLLLAPLYYSLRSNSFETQKWNDAVFQPAPGISTFPYAKNDDE